MHTLAKIRIGWRYLADDFEALVAIPVILGVMGTAATNMLHPLAIGTLTALTLFAGRFLIGYLRASKKLQP